MVLNARPVLVEAGSAPHSAALRLLRISLVVNVVRFC